MPLVLYSDVNESIGAIDSVRLESGCIVITGWTLDGVSERNGDFILYIDNKEVLRSKNFVSVHRADVIEAHGLTDTGARCGFQTRFELMGSIREAEEISIFYSENSDSYARIICSPASLTDRILSACFEEGENGENVKVTTDHVSCALYKLSARKIGALAFCIDNPSPKGVSIKNNNLLVSGWAIFFDKNPVSIGVLSDSGSMRRYHFNKKRPDVVRIYNDKIPGLSENELYGFSINIAIQKEGRSIGFLMKDDFHKFLDITENERLILE